MVEHLTLNQGVPGSSPCWCTKRGPDREGKRFIGFPVRPCFYGPLVKWPKTPASHAGNSGSNPLRVTIMAVSNAGDCVLIDGLRFLPRLLVGVDDGGGTPVPFPNTEVKPACADDTWLATAWKNR